MLKKVLMLGLTATVSFFASCDSNKEIKQFATDFSDVVNGGNIAKIRKLYPDVGISDSLSIAYDADSMSIEPTEKENQFVVRLNSKQSMMVEKDKDGQFYVVNSYGLFAYDPDILEFVAALGCYDTTLSDKENAGRMRDSAFVDYLNVKAANIIKKNVRLEQKDYWVDDATEKVSIAIYNETEFDLPRGSYVVTAKVYSQGDGPAFLRSSHEYTETITRGDAAYYVVPAIIDEMTYVRSSFSMNRVDLYVLWKIYRPTGSEYQDYCNQK